MVRRRGPTRGAYKKTAVSLGTLVVDNRPRYGAGFDAARGILLLAGSCRHPPFVLPSTQPNTLDGRRYNGEQRGERGEASSDNRRAVQVRDARQTEKEELR